MMRVSVTMQMFDLFIASSFAFSADAKFSPLILKSCQIYNPYTQDSFSIKQNQEYLEETTKKKRKMMLSFF